MTPDLATYDWIVISSSAGKDSQAMLDHVCELAATAGVLNRVVVVHCDLGRSEWRGTRDLAERQASRYGVRCEIVSRRQGDLLTHIESRGKWPGPSTRYCTSDHKRAQVHRVMTKLAAEAARTRFFSFQAPRATRVLDCQGLRADESPRREKMTELSFNAAASNGRRHVDTWLPIHAWTVDQVWDRIRAGRTFDLVHPAYGLGMPRLSCVFCIFAPKAALVLAGRHNRELLDEHVRIEQAIGHKFRLDVSMADVEAEVLAGEPSNGPIASWSM